ncbi:MAG: DNA cytosine methyltransferase [Ruminococcus sp.]|nr:DNA cytosine methyltransferase [Ruminococcus sp.]
MKVLVACEESQRVCTAFRELGHEAYSCDIQECSGGHHEWHIHGDVLPLINGNCTFTTMDGITHEIKGQWDLLIAHPPCTYLSAVTNRHLSLRCTPPEKVVDRFWKVAESAVFFMQFALADCERICVENPAGFMSRLWRKPDQIIHPYYFAENEEDTENYVQKRTCLWLKGLSKLRKSVDLPVPPPLYICQGELSKGKRIGWCEGMRNIKGGQAERAKARSKTFPGIARAMAEQWGGVCE